MFLYYKNKKNSDTAKCRNPLFPFALQSYIFNQYQSSLKGCFATSLTIFFAKLASYNNLRNSASRSLIFSPRTFSTLSRPTKNTEGRLFTLYN